VKLTDLFSRPPKPPPTCTRCRQQLGGTGCAARPHAIRFGMEAPGEPGGVVEMATSCPACQTPRGSYHHADCRFERERAG
jgi:hypothetical protein